MRPILTFLLLLIPLPTWPHQKLPAKNDHYVPKQRDVHKNWFICSDYGNRLEAQSTDDKQRKIITPLHAKSRATATALMWGYVGKYPVDRATKRTRSRQKHTLRNFRSFSRQWGDMTIIEVIGRHFPTSFPTVGNKPVDYKTNAALGWTIPALFVKRCSNAS